MALGVTCGLKCLHSKDIIHRDLHSKNILVNKGRLLIADFGLSKQLVDVTSNSMANRTGIIEYIDPQCFKNIKYVRGKEADIYSLGILFWEITSGRPPFCDDTVDRIALEFHIRNGLREEPIEDTPLEYRQLYQKCWDDDQKKRPDIDKVHEILSRFNTDNANEQHEDSSITSNSDSLNNIQSGYSDLCLDSKFFN